MASPTVKLTSGFSIPVVGLGTFDNFQDDRIADAVATAIEVGYRHVDTAPLYACEGAVGNGIARKIRDGTVKREDLFVVSKLWSTYHTRVEQGLRETLQDLQLDYLDLYLMHSPMAFKGTAKPQDRTAKRENMAHDFVETYKDMERLVDEGLVRSLGVSNFNQDQISRLLDADLKYIPVCNQIEIHPLHTNGELVEFCLARDVRPVAFSPLCCAGAKSRGEENGNLLKHCLMLNLASKYNKSPAQIILRWATQKGAIVIPQSVVRQEMEQNLQLFDFELTAKELAAISSLNTNFRSLPVTESIHHPDFPFTDVKARHGVV